MSGDDRSVSVNGLLWGIYGWYYEDWWDLGICELKILGSDMPCYLTVALPS